MNVLTLSSYPYSTSGAVGAVVYLQLRALSFTSGSPDPDTVTRPAVPICGSPIHAGSNMWIYPVGRNRVKLFFWGGGGGPYPDADTGFPEGGGGEDIHKHPPGHCPRDVIRHPKN